MYLPDIFKKFVQRHGEVSEAYRRVGELCAEAGSLDLKTQHLIQLAVATGASSKGGVGSHARRALDVGATEEEVFQTILLSMTLVGFPAMIAAYGWVDDVVSARTDE